MKRFAPRHAMVLLAVAFLGCTQAGSAQDATPPVPAAKAPEPVRVMILGTYHFGNPGLDLHNMKVDSVLTPQRQEELADLANRLARFAPNKIAVENTPDNPEYSDAGYQKFTLADLEKKADETVQIAFRLAHQLGHKAVYDIDEQAEFPFDKVQEYAKAHGQEETLASIGALVDANVKAMEVAQKTMPVRLTLAIVNEPARILSDNQHFYYGILKLADQQSQPGAALNAAWYERNARIFAKLLQVAKPGDRIVVVYGAGHSFWLRHFVENTPGLVLEDPLPYLK